MNKAEIKRMIKKLNNAYVSCNECGTEWGVPSAGDSSMWQGICRVCGETKFVTESRDYAYFYTGIHRLQQQLKELK